MQWEYSFFRGDASERYGCQPTHCEETVVQQPQWFPEKIDSIRVIPEASVVQIYHLRRERLSHIVPFCLFMSKEDTLVQLSEFG